uniref:Uncharacterized protein n=1 Tax=Dichotomaria marginata TaxID=268567 RepID=A0A1G4NSF3_9FLOR|nr:Hypothetical protein ycf58 [Dichotomaria marginata]SCW21535.1 Hypothetical protein ycf58 [Dichotomaria marginata]
MTDLNFFQSNIGKWKTLRTLYQSDGPTFYLDKSDIDIQFDNNTDYLIKNNSIYQKSQINLSKLQSKNLINISKRANPSKQIKYQMLYKFNNDRHISLEYNYGNLTILEKIWLVNSNLRLSISMIQKHNQCIFISFSSDIKIT